MIKNFFQEKFRFGLYLIIYNREVEKFLSKKSANYTLQSKKIRSFAC